MKLFKIFITFSVLLLFATLTSSFNAGEDGITQLPVDNPSLQVPDRQDETLAKANKTLREAVIALDKIMIDKESRIPVELLRKCEGIVIFPGAFKLAIGALGGQGGRGIAMMRLEGGSWSNPFYIWMSEGSVGAQIGAQTSDIVLLFKDRENIERMESAEVKLGSDVSATAGPVNREISARTNVNFKSEIYSYSRSKGLFAGVSVGGSVLVYNDELNDVFYDQDDVTVEEIFHIFQTPYNDLVSDFIETLNKYTKSGQEL